MKKKKENLSAEEEYRNRIHKKKEEIIRLFRSGSDGINACDVILTMVLLSCDMLRITKKNEAREQYEHLRNFTREIIAKFITEYEIFDVVKVKQDFSKAKPTGEA